MIKFYLASKSPRRLAILRQIGIEPIVLEPSVPEIFKEEDVGEYTSRLATMKANFAFAKIKDQNSQGIIIGADTEVSLNGEIFGQPENGQHAISMLNKLSGRSHQVTTSVSLIKMPEKKLVKATENTIVTFRQLDDSLLNYYISTGEPFDKAGGYGIQGQGALLVRKIEGCYFNVVGLPVSALVDCLNELDISVWDSRNG